MPKKTEVKKKISWSQQQKDVFQSIVSTASEDKNLIVRAVAGSGKSTTLFECIALASEEFPDANILFLAFNKEIEKHATKKLKVRENVVVQTFHGHGYSMIMEVFGKKKPKLVNNKVWPYLDNLVETKKLEADRQALGSLNSIISKIRSFGVVNTTPEGIEKLLYDNGESMLPMGAGYHILKNMISVSDKISGMFEELDSDRTTIDFDDMCRFPVVYNLFSKVERVPDIIFVDELQDLNMSQIYYLRGYKKVNPNLRVIAVGDPKQAIYGFRGAIDAIPKVAKGLKAKEMPLTTTYRTQANIVRWINKKCPSSDIVAHNKGGQVVELVGHKTDPYCSEDLMDQEITMILSPKNKHLIKSALIYMDNNIPVTLKGSGIIKSLVALTNMLAKRTIGFSGFMNELEKATKNRHFSRDKSLSDRAEALLAVIDHYGLKTVKSVLGKLENIRKTDRGTGVALETVHSAKGRESERVAVICDWFETEGGQDENMEYVAYTRAISKLVVVVPYLEKNAKYVPSEKHQKLRQNDKYEKYVPKGRRSVGGVKTKLRKLRPKCYE